MNAIVLQRLSDYTMRNVNIQLKKYLAKQGLKVTKQRQTIVDTFFRQKGHISAEELYAKIAKTDSGIGLATVYRTLKLLVEAGLASERNFGDGTSRYEPAKTNSHHDHLICIDCGRIEEFENPKIETLQNEVAAKNKFKVSDHKLELYGQCADCLKKEKSSNK